MTRHGKPSKWAFTFSFKSLLIRPAALAAFLTVTFFVGPLNPLTQDLARAAATPIELLSSNSASEVTDMRFLATRSQTKPLTKSGTGPYTITHTNANPALSYSYPTDANYGTSHSYVTNRNEQLYESDVRLPNGMSYSFDDPAVAGTDNRTANSAVLFSSGNIQPTPVGSSTSNRKVDGTPSYGSIFGPEVWSKPFLATTGQSVSFQWKAQGGGDDYEVYGFLVSIAAQGNCVASTDYGGVNQAEKLASHTILAYGRGLSAATYNTASGTVPSDGCYRFRFVNGTYDASGGYAVGATFFIQYPTLGRAHNISFTQLEDRVVQASDYNVSLVATTNANATVTFNEHLDSNNLCQLSGANNATLTLKGTRSGTCTIRADAGSTGEYAAAPTVYMSFSVLASATKPVYSGGASVSGSALVCSTLTVSEGVWASGGANITSTSIQWLSNGSPISGATNPTYTLTAADVGNSISFNVTKVNSVGSTTATPNSGLLVVDARLTALTLSSGALSPSFDTCATSYNVTTTSSTISVTPTISAGADAIQVNGSAVQSGQPTNPITLSPGNTSLALRVTSGVFSRDITVTVSYLAPPTVIALAPVLTSGTQVDLQASISANGFATSSITFDLVQVGGTVQAPTRGTLSAASVSGNTLTTITETVTDLVSGGTYEFTVTAVNSNGTTVSETITFQTPDAPTVTTGNTSNITPTSADVAGTVLGHGRDTAVTLLYSTNSDMSGATEVAVETILAADAGVSKAVSYSFTALSTGTRYYYQFQASNAVGENSGDIKSFVTVGAPTITHGTHSIGERSAELFATINVNGSDTTSDIKFIWSTNSSFTSPTEVTATPARAVAGANRVISVVLTGLTPNTNYWFKVTATNSAGTTTTNAEQFTTAVDPAPTVTLQAAASVTTGSAIAVTVRFSEIVTGLQAADFTIGGSPSYTAGNPQDLGSGVWQVTLTTASTSTGSVTIALGSNRVTDSGGQGNTAATTITVTVQAPMSNPTISLSYVNPVVPVAAMPTLNKGGSTGAATYSLLSYSANDAASGCAVDASTGAVTVTSEGKCRIQVTVAATASYFAATTEAFATFTKSSGQIVWGTSANAVTIRSPSGATRSTTLVGPDGSGRYSIEIKLGETVKIPFNSPNSERVGYSSYYKCPSVIGWDQSVMFPMDGSGNSFYYVNAKQIGACNISNSQTVPNILTLPASKYTNPISPGIFITVVKGDQAPIAVTGSSSANFGETVTLDATGGSGTGARTYAVTGTGCQITAVPFTFNGTRYAALDTAQLTKSGAGSCDVTVTKAGDTRYEPITSSAYTVTFAQGTQELAFTSRVPAVPSSGDVYTPAATASSGLTVRFSVSGTCTFDAQTARVTFNAQGACTVTASQAGDSDYLPATNVTQTISVGERNQTITFDSISDREYGDPAFQVEAISSVATLTVTFTSADTNVCTIDSVGIIVLKAAGTCTIHADQAGQAGVVAAASRVTRSFTVFPAGSSAPFITSVSRGLGSLTAAILPPSYTGGAAITKYEVQAFDADGNLVGFNNNCAPATPQICTVDGLVEGTNYTLKARAYHSAGFGELSPASAAAAPVGNPDAVRSLAAIAGDTTLTISWGAPLDLGGASFLRYDVYVKLATDANFPAAPAPYQINCLPSLAACGGSYTFTGMTNGESYDVKMVTITSVEGTEITSNTALVSQTPYTTPSAVQGLTAFEVGTDLFISWRYPAFDGGRTISSYTVDINGGALTCLPGTDRFCSIPKGQITEFDIDAFANNIAGASSAANYLYQVPVPMSSGGSGGSGGGTFIPPITPVTPGLNSPVVTGILRTIDSNLFTSLELTGTNLNLVTAVNSGNISLRYQILSNELIRISVPKNMTGKLLLQFMYSGGKFEKEVIMRPRNQLRVNAGTFNGVVALYAAGYQGQRFSALVDGKWIVVPRLNSSYVRLIQRSTPGKQVSVKIFINRQLARSASFSVR